MIFFIAFLPIRKPLIQQNLLFFFLQSVKSTGISNGSCPGTHPNCPAIIVETKYDALWPELAEPAIEKQCSNGKTNCLSNGFGIKHHFLIAVPAINYSDWQKILDRE